MSVIIGDLTQSFNLGQTMDKDQVAELINDIIDQYYWLNIEDFRLCFNNAKAGRYDKGIFRLDSSVILSWLNKYTSDRLNAAEESSYNASRNYADESVSNLENAYKEFERRKMK